MKQFQYVITDPVGIHARPAGLLVKAAKGLGVKGGDTVTVTVEGGNEEASLQAMEQFFRENL